MGKKSKNINMKENGKSQGAHKEHIADEEGFAQGDAYPNCDGEPCANVADGDAASESVAGKMAGEAAEWRDKYMRLSAEFDNYRKRTLREKMELVSSAGEDVMKSLLPILDDFERAIKAMSGTGDMDSMREGVVLIYNKLKDTLRAKGLTEIEAMGSVLDTDLHEAVAKVPGVKADKGKIIDVVQKGYKLGDKVIRYAKVVVGE